ncbi:MAG TPA: hypothetical protein VN452_05850, partial [Longilinea sp.]|nr:hypothetical protein [Longilinea sp.]
NYYYGKWNHLIWEENHGWYRLLRALPKSFLVAANIDWLWYHRKTLTFKKAVPWMKNQAKVALARVFGFLRPLHRAFLANSYAVNDRQPVFGHWEDNWIGPVFQVYLRANKMDEKYFIQGITALPCTIRVKEEGKVTQTVLAEAGKEIRIEFAAQVEQRVQLFFSNAKRDEKGRFTAFQINSTNLFAEGDAHF